VSCSPDIETLNETPAEKAQREAMWAFQDNITSQAIETGLVGGQGIIE
jgi:hypothetical protein